MIRTPGVIRDMILEAKRVKLLNETDRECSPEAPVDSFAYALAEELEKAYEAIRHLDWMLTYSVPVTAIHPRAEMINRYNEMRPVIQTALILGENET